MKKLHYLLKVLRTNKTIDNQQEQIDNQQEQINENIN
jgi:hypothetical protein